MGDRPPTAAIVHARVARGWKNDPLGDARPHSLDNTGGSWQLAAGATGPVAQSVSLEHFQVDVEYPHAGPGFSVGGDELLVPLGGLVGVVGFM